MPVLHTAPEFPVIEFVRVVPGYWMVNVDGVRRPIRAIRAGRLWHVSMNNMDIRKPGSSDEHLGSVRNMRDARSLMVAAWMRVEKTRDLAHAEALKAN